MGWTPIECREAIMPHTQNNREKPPFLPAELSEDDIRELLRPKTLIERNPRAVKILRALLKFPEIPGPIIEKIMGGPLKGTRQGIVGKMLTEGYIQQKRDVFNGHIVNMYSITGKGRKEILKMK